MEKVIARISFSFSILLRRLMQKIYDFDPWHVGPLMYKKYAQGIIEYCNNDTKRDSIVEIGCGLGDIIRNVHFKCKKGYDTEMNVLKAAKILAFLGKAGNITFSTFSFPQDKLKGTYDAIILVNWIHHIQPDILKGNIEKYFFNNLYQEGTIIIDTVQDKDYKVNHDINFLTKDLPCKIIEIGTYERQRTVWAIKRVQ